MVPREGQAKGECRPPPELALDLQLLAVQLDHLSGQCQAQARTPRSPRRHVASAVEALAQVVEIGRSDSRPVVADGDSGLTGAVERRCADRDVRSVGGVL